MRRNKKILYAIAILIFASYGIASSKTLTFNKAGLKIEAFKVTLSKILNEVTVKVKVTNVSGRVVKYAQVTCVLYNKGKMVDADSDYLQWHYTDGMPNGTAYHHTYSFREPGTFDSIGFDVTEVE